jgi:hypothetical protein
MKPRIAVVVFAVLLSACGSQPKIQLPLGRVHPKLPAPAGGTATAAMAASYGTTTYTVKGPLPEPAMRAPAFRFGAAGDVRRLADALGFTGALSEGAHRWVVTKADRQLRVEKTPGLPWTVGAASDCPPDADGCALSVEGGVAFACATNVPCPPQPRPEGLPSKADGERLARDTLTKAGVDLATAKVTFSDGLSRWDLTAQPQVGGLPTSGYSFSASVGPHGVIDASGWLAEPQRLADYTLVGVKVGLDRLKSGVGRGPMPMIAQAMPVCVPNSTNCPEPKPALITGVHVALAWVTGSDGVYLEPSYVFDLDGGGQTWAVPAVADSDLISPPTPVPAPGPPTGKGGGTAPGQPPEPPRPSP